MSVPTHDAVLPLDEPTMTFADLGLPDPVVRKLAQNGVTVPFPIQAATIPDALAGRDILGRGRTGSGKTLSFGLPLLARLAGGSTTRKRPRGVILTPTRELAMQVSDALQPYGDVLGLKLKVVCGGTSMGNQIYALERGVDILVATPGRLRDIIGRHERHPSWFGSLNNRFQWGPFDLTVLAVARWGYMLSSDFHADSNSLFGRYNNIRTNYWTPENPSNDDPRPNREREWPLYNESRMYKDGSHVRIRTISLGYQVPDTWVARFGGQSLRLYATAQDPYIFTSYDGFDPESNQAGGTGAGSPAYRTLLIGASVGF
jgi:hypothetical protein